MDIGRSVPLIAGLFTTRSVYAEASPITASGTILFTRVPTVYSVRP